MTKKIKANKSAVSRRQVVKGAGVAALAATFPTILTSRKAVAAIEITVRDPGGPYVEAFGEAYYKPFNEMMKGEVVVTGVAGKHEPTAQVKLMVDTGSYTWDMAHLSISAHNLLRDAGYLEELGIDDHPDVQEIPAHFRTPYLLGIDVYTTILAYRTDVYPKMGPEPTGGWKDLWDVNGIPGRRAIRKHAFDTIEQALMADGVAPDQLYPIDVDRAFAKMNEIRANIDVWWTSGAQSAQLIKDGEVDMIALWVSRVIGAIKDGDEIVGNETRVKVIKNKVAPPFKQAEFQILYGKGIYLLGEIIDLGVQMGFVDKAGAWYSYKNDRIGQGKKNAADFLKEHPEMAAEIEQRIRDESMGEKDAEKDESEDNVTPIVSAQD